MNIWILQTGEPLHIDEGKPRAMRAMNLSNKLVEAGHNVILWSSSFNHQQKSHRSYGYEKHTINNNLEIRLIPSRGYKRHIGIGRLIDHFQMAIALNKLLKKETKLPDVAFIGYPPIETAYVMSRWLRAKNIPMVLDIKDLWPSMFVEVFPKYLRPFARIIFHPYFYFSKITISRVESISAMAPGFIDWIMDYAKRKKSSSDRVFRLTSPNTQLPQSSISEAHKVWLEKGLNDKIPTIFFVGTFMSVFDFKPIKEAAEKLSSLGVNCQFVLCGEGAYLDDVKQMMCDLPNIIFPGWIDRLMIESLANNSIASLAPYKNIDNFIHNTPNKIVDSLMLGKPFLCPLEGEIKGLIKTYEVGFSYSDGDTLGDSIKLLIDNEDLLIQMSKNARDLYLMEFDFNKVYNSLVKHLENISKK